VTELEALKRRVEVLEYHFKRTDKDGDFQCSGCHCVLGMGAWLVDGQTWCQECCPHPAAKERAAK
jgi:hypothetical protein